MKRAHWILGLLALVGPATACEAKDEASDAEAEPKKKSKKKKDAAASSSAAADSRAGGTSTPLAPAPPVRPPAAPPSPAPAPAATFSKVDTSVWQPRLGPKMKVGSVMAHDVFEGPFGPSARSLFAVTRRPDNTFWVYVMGDDNKPWPAGPCAEPDLDLAHKIVAVSFFDADGDGNLDALVMAQYHDHRGHGPYHKNILLEWTSQGLRRLLNLSSPKSRA